MRLDHSGAEAFRFCPLKYFERYVVENSAGTLGIQTASPNSGMDFGSRMHQLLDAHYCQMTGRPQKVSEPLDDTALEAEAQAMLESYMAHYPTEEFEVVDTERPFEVPLESSEHTLTGKIDMLIRQDGQLGLFETKTEKRGGRDNDAEAWANKPQVALYKYAAEIIYGEPIEFMLLNVLTRGSPKGQEGPVFPPRQRLVRSRGQIEAALRAHIHTADQIAQCLASGYWPAYLDQCKKWSGRCEFYQPHTFGWDDATRKLFKPADDYIGLEVLTGGKSG